MLSSTPKSAYLRGMRDGSPFLFVAVPFALLFGVVATEAGLNVAQVMAFSTVVIAGAAQMTAMQLMVEDTPTMIILATALAVNLRMVMYSASLAPYVGKQPLWKRSLIGYALFDQTYAAAIVEFEKRPDMSQAQRVQYYAGTATPIIPAWIIATYVGAVLGAGIPPEFALDFALPITFLAMLAPMMKTPAHVAAAATSIILTLVFAFIPYNLGLLIAAVAALVVGVQVETRFLKATV